MKTVQLITIIIVALNILILYVPTLSFKQSERLTRDELISTFPNLTWLKWVYPLVQGLWLLFTLVLCLVILVVLGEKIGEGIFYLIGSFLSAASIFDGSIAIATGIRPVPTRGGYLFVYNERTHLISWLQILLSVGVIAFVATLVL
jgi:hypothetical protein